MWACKRWKRTRLKFYDEKNSMKHTLSFPLPLKYFHYSSQCCSWKFSFPLSHRWRMEVRTRSSGMSIYFHKIVSALKSITAEPTFGGDDGGNECCQIMRLDGRVKITQSSEKYFSNVQSTVNKFNSLSRQRVTSIECGMCCDVRECD